MSVGAARLWGCGASWEGVRVRAQGMRCGKKGGGGTTADAASMGRVCSNDTASSFPARETAQRAVFAPFLPRPRLLAAGVSFTGSVGALSAAGVAAAALAPFLEPLAFSLPAGTAHGRSMHSMLWSKHGKQCVSSVEACWQASPTKCQWYGLTVLLGRVDGCLPIVKLLVQGWGNKVAGACAHWRSCRTQHTTLLLNRCVLALFDGRCQVVERLQSQSGQPSRAWRQFPSRPCSPASA